MLFDPAPHNDPGDPGWDMSAYAKYSGGSATFSNRRLEERPSDTSIAFATADADGETRSVSLAEYHSLDAGRQLASATEAGWINRMVFYTGDERNFYPLAGRTCDPSSALYDPTCRTKRKTHREVAYRGYGTYRGEAEKCALVKSWNAWNCSSKNLIPARFVVESMDEDHTSRSLVPVALASGGYVDLMNAGWDHQDPKVCGGYGCLKRLMVRVFATRSACRACLSSLSCLLPRRRTIETRRRPFTPRLPSTARTISRSPQQIRSVFASGCLTAPEKRCRPSRRPVGCSYPSSTRIR